MNIRECVVCSQPVTSSYMKAKTCDSSDCKRIHKANVAKVRRVSKVSDVALNARKCVQCGNKVTSPNPAATTCGQSKCVKAARAIRIQAENETRLPIFTGVDGEGVSRCNYYDLVSRKYCNAPFRPYEPCTCGSTVIVSKPGMRTCKVTDDDTVACRNCGDSNTIEKFGKGKNTITVCVTCATPSCIWHVCDRHNCRVRYPESYCGACDKPIVTRDACNECGISWDYQCPCDEPKTESGNCVEHPRFRQNYVMLSVGNITLTRAGITYGDDPTVHPTEWSESIITAKNENLNHYEIFQFLWDCYIANEEAKKNSNSETKKRDIFYAGFFLGYDFTMWCRSLPIEEARALHAKSYIDENGKYIRQGPDVRKPTAQSGRRTPFPVYVHNNDGECVWELDFLGIRRMTLAPHVHMPVESNQAMCRCRKILDISMEAVLSNTDPMDRLTEGMTDEEREKVWAREAINLDEIIAQYVDDGIDVSPAEAFRSSTTFIDNSNKAIKQRQRAYEKKSRKKKNVKHPHGTLTICDTGSFYQSSFLVAIDPTGEAEEDRVVTPEEFELLVNGKDNRTYALLDEDMRKYNVMENEILSRLLTQLYKGFKEIGIVLKKTNFYGPGQAAQEWLNQGAGTGKVEIIDAEGNVTTQHPHARNMRVNGELVRDGLTGKPKSILSYSREYLRHIIKPEFWEWGMSTYYGGWFEAFAHGHVGDAYEYDINSAYPYQIRDLPCLEHVKFIYGKGPVPAGERHVIVDGTFVSNHPVLGSMTHRSTKGEVKRPAKTTGRHWIFEVDAMSRANPEFSYEIAEWLWLKKTCDCTLPFRKIADLYMKRVEGNRKNTPYGKALKLVYNSAYGKLCQSVGSPKYGNPFYASLITAGCRTMILDAIATHPNGADNLLMIATDGIYFAQPHKINPKQAHPDYDNAINQDAERKKWWNARTETLAPEPTHYVNPAQYGVALQSNNAKKACKALEGWNEYETACKALGGWEAGYKPNMTIFLPGIYWDDYTRQTLAKGDTPALKSRGVSAKFFKRAVPDLDKQFDTWNGEIWPSTDVIVSFNITSGSLAWSRDNKYGMKWKQTGNVDFYQKRLMNATASTKRSTTSRPSNANDLRQPWSKETRLKEVTFGTVGYKGEVIYRTMWRSFPIQNQIQTAEEARTTYYDKRFGEEREEHEMLFTAIFNPDIQGTDINFGDVYKIAV